MSGSKAFSRRAYVANTLAYRRRKGTAAVLEQLARDATGWNARAVEFFELLETTQHANHVRLHSQRTPDLRRTDALELVDTAFDTAAHSLDVRRIARGRGRHNIPNVGLFLWRLQSYPVTQATPRAVTAPSDGRYRFSPLGDDIPLFNRPRAEAEITHLAGEENVPGPLRRLPLYRELEAHRQALVDAKTPDGVWFGNEPVLRVFVRDTVVDPLVEIPAREITICHLGDHPTLPGTWQRPPAARDYRRAADDALQSMPIRAGVDPVLGRLAFPESFVPHEVRVSYAYGFSGDVGAGPYDRLGSPAAARRRDPVWQVGVGKDAKAEDTETIFPTLLEAVQEWNAQPAGTVGIIAILDSLTYEETLTGAERIEIPEGSQLLIAAADWPAVPRPGGAPGKRRVLGQLTPADRRPHLLGDVEVAGTAPAASETPGELILDGLLIEGKLTVADGHLGALTVTHSTLVPQKGGLAVAKTDTDLRVHLGRSICGPVALPAGGIDRLSVDESLVDNPQHAADAGANAIAGNGSPVALRKSTFLGRVRAQRLDASEVLFVRPATAERLQAGCVRFSYVPAGSKTPRRYRCQPDLALREAPLSEHPAIRARLAPSFTSVRYNEPGYGQLLLPVPEELCDRRRGRLGDGGVQLPAAAAAAGQPARRAGGVPPVRPRSRSDLRHLKREDIMKGDFTRDTFRRKKRYSGVRMQQGRVQTRRGLERAGRHHGRPDRDRDPARRRTVRLPVARARLRDQGRRTRAGDRRRLRLRRRHPLLEPGSGRPRQAAGLPGEGPGRARRRQVGAVRRGPAGPLPGLARRLDAPPHRARRPGDPRGRARRPGHRHARQDRLAGAARADPGRHHLRLEGPRLGQARRPLDRQAERARAARGDSGEPLRGRARRGLPPPGEPALPHRGPPGGRARHRHLQVVAGERLDRHRLGEEGQRQPDRGERRPRRRAGFASGQWIELTDRDRDLLGETGTLVRLKSAKGRVLEIDPATKIGPSVELADYKNQPRVRRWESQGALKIETPGANGGWLPLEDGVEVRFEAGTYRTGDYWYVPARTATGDVEWPRDAGNNPVAQLAQGILHHHCRLAMVTKPSSGPWKVESDCRPLFPPLADLISFYFRGGDGQEVNPDPLDRDKRIKLPETLVTSVTLGPYPLQGRTVRFTVTKGDGRLTGGANVRQVLTGAGGRAACEWELDGKLASQEVKAELLGPDGNPMHTPIFFRASLSEASRVSYDPKDCPPLLDAKVRTVQEAITELCKMDHGGGCEVTVGKEGQFESIEKALEALQDKDVCLCLLPGEHKLAGGLEIVGNLGQRRHVSIHGCHHGARIAGTNKPILARGLASFELRNLEIEYTGVADAIVLDDCDDVAVTSCDLHGEADSGAMLTIGRAGRIRLVANGIRFVDRTAFERNRVLFAALPEIGELFRAQPGRLAERRFEQAAEALVARPRAERVAASRGLRAALANLGNTVDPEELESARALMGILAANELNRETADKPAGLPQGRHPGRADHRPGAEGRLRRDHPGRQPDHGDPRPVRRPRPEGADPHGRRGKDCGRKEAGPVLGKPGATCGCAAFV